MDCAAQKEFEAATGMPLDVAFSHRSPISDYRQKAPQPPRPRDGEHGGGRLGMESAFNQALILE